MSFEVRKIQAERKPRTSLVWLKRAALLALTLSEPLLGWYDAWKARKEKEERRTARLMLLKRTFAILVALLIAVALLAGIAKALFSVEFSFRQILSVAGSELPQDDHGHLNLLLLGGGDDSHSGKDLMDTIIVASIDRDAGTVAMLSIPRDLYVTESEKMGVGRINSLYRDYKGYLRSTEDMTEEAASQASLLELKDEIGRKLGMQIHHVVKVDFIAFEQAVDALGGIDVVVPESIVDTEYPGPDFTYETFSITAGQHRLDGATALKYARSRHTTSDFDRSARQQQILVSLMNRSKELKIHKDVGKITEIYGILSEHVETTLKTGELITLATIAEDFSVDGVATLQLNDQNGLYGGFVGRGGFLYAPPREQFEGASVLLPVSIPEFPVTWKQLQTLAKIFFVHPTLFADPQPRIAVLNAGANEGAARLLGGELLRYGFNVVEIGNSPAGRRETSAVASRPVAGEDAENPWADDHDFLGTLLKLPDGPYPAGSIEGAPDVTILLGPDFRYAPLQDIVP